MKLLVKLALVGVVLSPFMLLGTTLYQVNLDHSRWQSQPAGDCLMILGSKVLSNNQPDLMMKERVGAASRYLSDSVETVILTGGTVDHKKPEAEVLKQLLIQEGVEQDQMILETNSTSTYENLLFSKPLILEADCEKLDILSHDFHLARVQLTAERLGIEVNRYLPAEERPNSKRRLTREYAAYMWYWLGWKWFHTE